MSLHDLLENLRLTQYEGVLTEEGYDEAEDLSNLSQDEMLALGLKAGHAKRILKHFGQQQPGSGVGGATMEQREGKEPDPHRPIYRGPKKSVTLLLFGETGVGKSTLLQSLGDFIEQVPFGQHNRTEKVASIGASQTQESDMLNFNNAEWDVNIIDTPGLGDTRGMSFDENHVSNLQAFLANKEFNAVCILIKRGTTRSVALLNYVVNELKANMPKKVAEQFIVVMTRAEIPVPDEDTLGVIEGLHLPLGNIIPVNNIAYEEMDLSKWRDKSGSAFIRNIERRQERNYEDNHEYLQQLLELAHGFEPYQGNQVVELKVKRDLLRERVALLKMKVDSSVKVKFQLARQQVELRDAKGDIAKARAAIQKSESYWEDVPYKLSGSITTHCNACSKACHVGCGLSYGDNLTSCCAMNGSSCRQCGHSVSSHTHLGWGKRSVQRVREMRDEEKVREMNSAQSVAEAVARRQNELQADMQRLARDQDAATTEIRDLYNQLSEIAILGWNDSYEKYMLECKQAVEEDAELSPAAKAEKIRVFQTALAKIEVFKSAVGNALGKRTATRANIEDDKSEPPKKKRRKN